MIQDFSKPKYFIYARKSSESDEKQVQSIEDQIFVLQAFTKANGIYVVDVLSEARSAKEPGDRPIFETLLRRIKAGEATGIIVWKIDRLARNPIDGASIQWLLQKGVLHSIRTPDREYRPEDNVLILNVESSMATQYILDLSKNVKRGLKSKIEKGWRPCRTPLGYLNTKTESVGENYIIKDPVRFDIIKKMWDLMLTGHYLPTQILAMANNEWGLRTRHTKKSGGNVVSKSLLYMMFANIFYTGFIDNKGVYVQGKHEPMITMEEFDRVQFLLGRKGRPRMHKHQYAYTGLIRCGECQGTISATSKQKLIIETGRLKDYSLYYCICARKGKNGCEQIRYTNAVLLDQAIEEMIVSFSINPKFSDWVFLAIDYMKGSEITTETNLYEMQQELLTKINKKLEALTQMRIREMIDDEEYMKERTKLKNEITLLESKIEKTAEANNDWIIPTQKAFEFAFYALSAFQNGSAQIRHEILSAITGGLNCSLKDKILIIPKAKWLVCLQENINSMESKFEQLELEKSLDLQRQNLDNDPVLYAKLALVDAVRTELTTSTEIYNIPIFNERDKAA
jgi:site-specific DNA recombinase